MLTVNRFYLGGSLLALLGLACNGPDPLEPSIETAAVVAGLKAPSGADATPANSSSIQLTWIDNSTNEEGFRIQRSATTTGPWETAGTTGPNVRSMTDGGRKSEQQVCYRILAFKNKNTSNASNTDCTVPPAAATGLTATAADHQAIDLVWKDNSAVEDGYELQRAKAEAGPYAVVANLSLDAASYRDGGLETGTTYWYRVRAKKDAGFGDFSNSASATPVFAPPKAPSAANATPGYGGTVEIKWVDNATNEDGFRVERSLDGGSTWTTALTLYLPNATWSQDYGPPSEQQACYRVIAFNRQGDSPASNTDCTTPPAAPTDLTATGVDAQTIDLAWKDNSAVEDGYEVQRADGVVAYTVVALLPPNSTSYRDAGVKSNTTYLYKVRAQKDGGVSDFSNIARGVAATSAPDAPIGTEVRPASSTDVVVAWTDNSSNEESFRVERSTDGQLTWTRATSANPYDFVDTGRQSEQEVCYRVFAVNSKGDSPPSNTDCTTPPAAPTDLVSVGIDEQTVEHQWRDNSSFEDGYDLWLIGFDGWDYYYYPVSLPPNTTRYQASTSEGVYGVVAVKDGGYSDWAFPAGAAAAAAHQKRTAAVRRPPPSAQRTPPALEGRQRTMRLHRGNAECTAKCAGETYSSVK